MDVQPPCSPKLSSHGPWVPLKEGIYPGDSWHSVAMELEMPMLVLLLLLIVPLMIACTSMWFYRKQLRRLLPDLTKPKATKREHYLFKVQTEEQLRKSAAEADAAEGGGVSGGAVRSLTMRPDEVPQQDHMESLVLDGDQVLEMRRSASKTSMGSSVPGVVRVGSQTSSGENEMTAEARTLPRAGSKQSVGSKRRGRSTSKQSRAGSKASSSRPEPQHPQLQRSLSESEAEISHGRRTLGEELAFRDLLANMLWSRLFVIYIYMNIYTH